MERAAEAQRLLDDQSLLEVFAEIEGEAVKTFLNTSSALEDREAAHRKVQAVATIRNALQARVNAGAILKKREHRHRGND